MDPASALALACNAVQVAELGVNTIKLCLKLYREGSCYDDLAFSMESFSKANQDLRSSLRPAGEHLALGKDDQEILDICQNTCAIASKLGQTLEPFKASTDVTRKRKVVPLALKALWNRSNIHELRQRLSDHQILIRHRILVEQRSVFHSRSAYRSRPNGIDCDADNHGFVPCIPS